jgi:hypothetical protein
MIRLKNLILESPVGRRLIEAETATGTTIYEFEDSFPDNIVLPIKSGQTGITSFDSISDVKQLTPSLQDFINTLNSAVESGKLKTGNISIAAEANSGTAATKLVPKGWDQKQVDFSYSNGATVSNQTLADRRAEAIESMIKKFVKLPAEVTITKTGNGNGSKKSAKATVPILTYNKDSNTTVGEYKETVNVNATKYTAPAYSDAKIELTKCGAAMKANGLAGDPIAYRTKLEPTSGTISITFQPYYVPDRAVITKVLNNVPTVIYDSGYVSADPIAAQVDFGKLLDELNKTKPNGYDGQIKRAGEYISTTLDDPKATYFFEVYAPLGPTFWSAELACNVSIGEGKTPPKPVSTKVLKNGGVRLYFKPDHSQIVSEEEIPEGERNKYDIAFNGTMKNGKYFEGKEYEYDDLNILLKVTDWTKGTGKEGTLDS